MKKYIMVLALGLIFALVDTTADARPFGRVARGAFRIARAPVVGAVRVVQARPGWIVPKRQVHWCEW